ncbi:putative hydrolase [Trichoderma lentiforme]|uniref:Hydrolase n=1 Tax=Trichoderma lentiforme TaxID=1567552 RepID=A0A9P4XCM4_9HYPO|nr:putative hydrolase [Trichoderma lentiforme]
MADGVKVFYREAGDPRKPAVLLLHGFPASSHQYRNLIPILAQTHYVLAPDFPGYGFTQVPDDRSYNYTYENLATTTLSWLEVLEIKSFVMYIMDIGAPVGLRIALRRPNSVSGIITQNGNAYTDGFGDGFMPVLDFSRNPNPNRTQAAEEFLTFSAIKSQYTTGVKDPSVIQPEAYYLDFALLSRPGNDHNQLDLLHTYQSNVDLYPAFHKYFRDSQPPLLAIWGKNDVAFVPTGAEAFKKDLPNAQIHFVDSGHFALESELEKIAERITLFLAENNL